MSVTDDTQNSQPTSKTTSSKRATMNNAEKSFHLALNNARKLFKISRDKINPRFGSKYISLDEIILGTEEALRENGLNVISYFQVEDDGNAQIVTELHHVDGHCQGSVFPVPTGLDMQKLGSTITYARRYNLSLLLNIVADEDDDGNAATPTDLLSQSEMSIVVDLVKKHKWETADVKRLLSKYGYSSSKEVKKKDFAAICNDLKNGEQISA